MIEIEKKNRKKGDKNMKNLLKIMIIIIVGSTVVLHGKIGDECDVKHPYHPIVQDAKLIASFAKIWWIADKMEKHASDDAEQKQILATVKNTAHDIKDMLIKALTKRVLDQQAQGIQIDTSLSAPQLPSISEFDTVTCSTSNRRIVSCCRKLRNNNA